MDKINNNYFFFNSEVKNPEEQKRTKKTSAQIISKHSSIFHKMLMLEEENNNCVEHISEKKEKQNDEIALLLKEISAKGRSLKKDKKVEDLEDYKKLVQTLLKKVVFSAEKVEKIEKFNSKTKEKVCKLHLQIINKNLLDLTHEFMKEQRSVITIAAKIDKIEGLLVDLLS